MSDGDQIVGPTGEYPNGKINDQDEGGLQIAIAPDPKSNVVIIDFGISVNWVGLGKDDVDKLCASLQQAKNQLL